MAKSQKVRKRVFSGQLAYLTRSPARFWDHFLAKNRCLSLLNRPKTVFLGVRDPKMTLFWALFGTPFLTPFSTSGNYGLFVYIYPYERGYNIPIYAYTGDGVLEGLKKGSKRGHFGVPGHPGTWICRHFGALCHSSSFWGPQNDPFWGPLFDPLLALLALWAICVYLPP